MDSKYVAPRKGSKAFNCPYCGAYSNMTWLDITFHNGCNNYGDLSMGLSGSKCSCCRRTAIWLDNEIIIPSCCTVPTPLEDTPTNVKELYNEAREIVNKSPRGAAALLRLALDKLCDEVCEDCKAAKYSGKIDAKIGVLVAHGLSSKLQEAFDFVRVTGNDAVHELGLIDIQDNPDIACALFELINFIVEKMIVENKQIEGLYNMIPESRREKIKERNIKALGEG